MTIGTVCKAHCPWWLLAGPPAAAQLPVPPSIAVASSALGKVGVVEAMPASERKYFMELLEVFKGENHHVLL